jgi:sugar phosphate isomerase/epimerase
MQNTVSRREFVRSSSKAALGAYALGKFGSLSLRAAQPEAQGGRAPTMRLGLQTYLWAKDWDIPTILANLQKAQVYGVECRTSDHYGHGIELTLTKAQRAEVKKRFADSPVTLVSVASAEELDWPDDAQFKTAVQAAKDHVVLAQDVGGTAVRVFPNKWHPNVPHEKTVERIAQALNEIGPFAADHGILIGLEAHGPVGELPVLKDILSHVQSRAVGVKLNSDNRDTRGAGFEANFNLIKDRLSNSLHLKNLKDASFPYQLMIDLLVKNNWNGWALMEYTHQVPDKVEAMIEHRKLWDEMLAKAMSAQRK